MTAYETQTFTRAVFNYETRTRTVHDPHYEPPARTGVTCGPPIQVGSPLWNQLGCDPPPPPRDRSRDDSQDPVIGAVKAIGKAAQAVNDWWVGDPLNGPAEKTFDNLNTVVETLGDESEELNDIVDEMEEVSETIVCNPAVPYVAGGVGFGIGTVSGVRQAGLGDPAAPGRNAQAGWQSGIIVGQAAQQAC